MGHSFGPRNLNTKEKFLDRAEAEGVTGAMLVHPMEVLKKWLILIADSVRNLTGSTGPFIVFYFRSQNHQSHSQCLW